MKIGFSQANINPVTPVELAGYGYNLDRLANTVDSPLTASALTFEDKDGNRAALCSVDLISVGRETVVAVQDSLRLADVDRSLPILAINASHNHSGPASRQLLGAGGYNPRYVNEVLVPGLSNLVAEAFDSATDGEIGIQRGVVNGLSYNRVNEDGFDNRITVIGISTERLSLSGIHFACHPVVYGQNSKVISSDYPGFARSTLRSDTNLTNLWLTGCCGEIDPMVNKDRKGNTDRSDVRFMGERIGHCAAELYRQVSTSPNDIIKGGSFDIEVPINTGFELDPDKEVEIYREVRGLPRTADMTPLKNYFLEVAPTINSSPNQVLKVPAAIISVGKIAFVGFGAEIYSSTGMKVEAINPGMDIVTMMTTNEHEGYIPPIQNYEANVYSARGSAFIFGRKPLTPSSEAIFRQQVAGHLNAVLAR